MKYYTYIAIAFIVLSSCTKKECNCGLITSDGITTDVNLNNHYTIDIRNQCSQNVKTFELTQGDWMNAHPGNSYCITNINSW